MLKAWLDKRKGVVEMKRHLRGKVIEAFLDGELSKEDAIQVLKHILECEQCEELADEIMNRIVDDEDGEYRITGNIRWIGQNGVIPEPSQGWDNALKALEG